MTPTCCRKGDGVGPTTVASIITPQRCAENAAFMLARYCRGASGDALMHSTLPGTRVGQLTRAT